MARTTQLGAWWLGLGVLATAGMPAHAQEPEDPRVRKVFADWQKRWERIKIVRYTAEGERFRPKGGGSSFAVRRGEVPAKDMTYPLKYVLLLDLPGNRYRKETDEYLYQVEKKELIPNFWSQTFDGKVVQGQKRTPPGSAPPTDTQVGIGSGDLRATAFDKALWPMFIAHGIVCANDRRPMAGKLRPDLDPELFYVHGQGVQAGRPCLVLRTRAVNAARPHFDELWVDPEHDSAVLRHVIYSGGMVFTDTEVRYRKTPSGWLPQGWTYTARSGQAESISFQDRMRVTELLVEPDVTDAAFQIDTPPGALIVRINYRMSEGAGDVESETTHFRVREDGTWQEVVIENGVERPRRRFSPWWGLGLLPLAGGAYLLFRNLRREEARPPAGAHPAP